LWVRYAKQAATPPSAGYTSCNGSKEYTRWQEGFGVFLLQQGGSTPTSATDPLPTDPQSDDPKNDQVGVRLGVVTVKPDPTTNALFIDSVDPSKRTYIGLRAQRIVTPVDVSKFELLKAQTGREPATSLDLYPNVFAKQNLIVGDDFEVKKETIQPPPPAGTFPPDTGNAKIASDVFLQGELYTQRPVPSNPSPAWLSLGAFIKSILPDVQTGSQKVVIPALTAAQINLQTGQGSAIQLTPKLAVVDQGKVQVSVSIAGVEFNQGYQTANPNQAVQFSISWQGNFNAAGTMYTLIPIWLVNPCLSSGGNPALSPLVSMSITYVVVFYPL
jgi:hypothetical protein